MPHIVTCSCGARVRVPEGAAQALRCPRCKSAIAVGAEPSPPQAPSRGAGTGLRQAVPNRGAETGAVCPICQTGISAGEEMVACPACDQVHHQECWTEVGGCGTYGCERAPAIDKADAGPQARRSAWGDTKECPACRETIKAIALRCRYCGTEFDTVDPLTARDLRRRVRREEEARSLQKTVVAVFILSLIGLLAPIMLFVAPVVVLPRHKRILKAGPIYAVLGYTAIALSVLYSALWLAFALLSR